MADRTEEHSTAGPGAGGAGRRYPMPERRQTWAEIDLGALKANYAALRALAPAPPEVVPVVKAEAYGHGAGPVARALAEAGAAVFAVGAVEEGVALRRAGVAQDILVLSTTWSGQEPLALEHRLILAIDAPQSVAALDAAAREKGLQAPVHVKIDTGMGRLGVRGDLLGPLLDALRRAGRVVPDGVFTHLARADEADPAFTEVQTRRFEAALAALGERGLRPRRVHCANSAGLLYHPALRKWGARAGIALYGYAPGPLPPPVELRPVLSLQTRVGPVRRIPAGEPVGYGGRFVASRPTCYATLPIGYADGLPRGLSGNCRAIVSGRLVAVIGTISMDMVAVDLTDLPEAREGDVATLLGAGGGASLTAQAWAGPLGTIPYEILCGISWRVPRLYT